MRGLQAKGRGVQDLEAFERGQRFKVFWAVEVQGRSLKEFGDV